MDISVIGCGYLGAVHAACMADLGHTVVGVDVDADKVRSLNSAIAPFHEPGFEMLLRRALDSGRLRFSTSFSETRSAIVHFLAVGTPQVPGGGAANLVYVHSAVESLIPHLRAGALVAGKSTVPIGTAESLAEQIETVGARLAWNPEFLREGHAVADTLEPDRIVVGTRADDDYSVALLDEVYASALARATPRIVTDFATAELVKVAANAFLATKISFINAMSEVAEVIGADVTQLADALGHDKRIGRRFLNAGVGFGGGCLPKDIRAFAARGEELGVGRSLRFLAEVDAINLRQRDRVVQKVVEACEGDVSGRRVAVFGLAFKPDSDDVRDSPALDIARRLYVLGAHVTATDPAAIETSRRVLPQIDYTVALASAAADADVVVILTEWAAYTELMPGDLADIVARPYIVDARNCLTPHQWREAGWVYLGLGR